ncbi:GNAT family N-acetyltransferase [Alcaligenaceae bacterium 429]|uniref:GNAT family N-acetyltransferase n=1 Tax=Paenalcaligenes sp. Me52 TaxID=3392038 RepID=UPI001092E962|nr:GNAT family N-acetyltransferase [Alcaligenaceae bacterium 429]
MTTPTLYLRAAHASDLAPLGQLKLRAALAWGEHTEKLRQLPDIDQVDPNLLPQLIVAELQKRLVGFASLELRPALSQVQLDDLFVDPDYWHQGIGAALLRAAEKRAYHLGATELQLVSNPKAREFYIKQGYLFRTNIRTDLGVAPVFYKPLSN